MNRFLLIILMAGIHWSAVAQTAPSVNQERPFVLGKTVNIYSRQLNEQRTLNIYLPEGYTPGDTTHFPVIYLLDGGADEDFIHVVGLVQFNSFPWMDRMPPSIVVGIANHDRKRDFTYPTTLKEDQKLYPTTGHSAVFIDFLEKDLQPFIEKSFRTNRSKTLIGESLGGLLAAEILLKRPALFNQYIIVSPSLWWDNGSLLKFDTANLKKESQNPMKVYIGVGKEGVWPGPTPHVMEVDANLLADKLKALKSPGLSVFFDYLPEENHATIAHQAIFNAIKWLYPGKKEK